MGRFVVIVSQSSIYIGSKFSSYIEAPDLAAATGCSAFSLLLSFSLVGSWSGEAEVAGEASAVTVAAGEASAETVVAGEASAETAVAGEVSEETVVAVEVTEEIVIAGEASAETVVADDAWGETVVTGEASRDTVVDGWVGCCREEVGRTVEVKVVLLGRAVEVALSLVSAGRLLLAGRRVLGTSPGVKPLLRAG